MRHGCVIHTFLSIYTTPFTYHTYTHTYLHTHTHTHIRALILECVFRLYNVRARCMKLNQITTVFDEDYVPSIYDANTAERIRRYYKIDE